LKRSESLANVLLLLFGSLKNNKKFPKEKGCGRKTTADYLRPFYIAYGFVYNRRRT